MNRHEQNRMKELLKQAMPPVAADAEPERDLWPALLQRLDENPSAAKDPSPARSMQWSVPWFDWALLGGLVVFAASFPATIPVFLYYL
ncbi:MAG: hypothetical protein WBP85_09860 [Terracidiphilus sp.]